MQLDFLFVGNKKESKYFSASIGESESPDRIRICTSLDDVDRFVYPMRYVPPSPWLVERGRVDDPGFDYLGAIAPAIIEGIRAGRGVLLIDSSNEQYAAKPPAMSVLHDRLRAMGIPFDRVVFLTQNTDFPDQYETWCRGEGIAEGMFVLAHHYYMRQLANYVANEMIPSGEHARRLKSATRQIETGALREKHFLNLTFTPRPHRVAMMLYILQHDLIDRGIVSFPGLQNRKLDLRTKIEPLLQREPFPDKDGLMAQLPRLHEIAPVELDVDRFAKVSPVIDIGQAWYYEATYFSLVTDSGVNTTSANRNFTEKPLKALLGLHPMLLMGYRNSLAHLRSFGFQSFAPVFDESYDGLRRGADRLSALLGEFTRLCALPREEWQATYAELFPRVLHNYNAFTGPLQTHLRERLEDPIFARLQDRLAA